MSGAHAVPIVPPPVPRKNIVEGPFKKLPFCPERGHFKFERMTKAGPLSRNGPGGGAIETRSANACFLILSRAP